MCIGFALKLNSTVLSLAALCVTSVPLIERTSQNSDQRLVFSLLRSDVVGGDVRCGVGYGLRGAAEGRPLVTDNQIGALILEDLAFPLRHNNALCAALPVSQAREEGTGRLSHSSHRFLSTSLPLLRSLARPPSQPALTDSPLCSQTSDSVVSFNGGKDDCT